jgi:hypothetical protein
MGSSSNTQINNYMEKHFKGDFLGCFNADNLPSSPPPSSNLIANYSNTNDSDNGTHWIAMINLNSDNGQPSYYFDSFGGNPGFEDGILNKDTHFGRYMDRHGGNWARNNVNIQDADGTACGHYAVYAIMNQSIPLAGSRGTGASACWKSFLSPYTNPKQNDARIRSLVKL